MHDPEDVYDWETEIARIYREIVAEHGDDGIAKLEAFGLAMDRILPLVAEGALKVPADEAILSALKKADDSGRKIADKALRILATGQDNLDTEGDPILKMVVTLGSGLRKAYRYITLADLERMDNLRYDNIARANKAYAEEWRPLYAAWRPVLQRHSTLGDAIDAGDGPDGFSDA